jgi:hypothetical protein
MGLKNFPNFTVGEEKKSMFKFHFKFHSALHSEI